MSVITQESKIILAIEAIRTSKKLSRRKAAKLYEVPFSTLNDRMNGHLPLLERRPANIKLSKLEEEVIIRNILDMDSRGFAPRLAGVEDMANYHPRIARRETRRQASRPIDLYNDNQTLKTRFNRVYDFQRALCEDSELIGAWFRLVENMKGKIRGVGLRLLQLRRDRVYDGCDLPCNGCNSCRSTWQRQGSSARQSGMGYCNCMHQ